MVLTNMLPGQGNGTYQFFMWAQDREGRSARLGTRTMTCANATATLPFGAIDTPTQGGVASGAAFVNFAWVLTPLPKTIPLDGSTITVLVDGVAAGPASYNHFRGDIAFLFPGLNNTNGAVGFRMLNTTALTNGTHTIVWVVSDDAGAAEGIGSRFFTVSNGTGGIIGTALTGAEVDALPLEPSALVARRGWELDGAAQAFAATTAGRTVIRSEEVNRVELWLGADRDGPGVHYTGYLRAGDGLASLPIGSHLEAATGVFTWAPGVGFVGPYHLVFVRWAGGRATARRDVRILLQPKGSGAVGPQVMIDVPAAQQTVDQPFMLAGWAADLRASSGTGIATLHAWAYPVTGGAPLFLGATAYGGVRPDVAAVHGSQFRESGFGMIVQGLPAGTYDLAVFAWSNVTGAFAPPNVVHVTVR